MKRKILYIIILLQIQLIVGQKNKTVNLKASSNTKDSIEFLQKKQHLLNLSIQKTKKEYTLKGIQVSDTLYIYIKNNNTTDSIATHFGQLNFKLNNYNKHNYKKGYIFNKLSPDSIKVKKNHIYLFYQSTLNRKAIIDSITFHNKYKIPPNINQYLIKHFYRKNLDSTNLSALNIFINQNTKYGISKPAEIWFKNQKNILVLNVTPYKHNTLNALLGFDYDQDEKKLLLSGYLNTKLYNLFGISDQLHFFWQKNSNNQKYAISLHTPYLFGTNLSAKYDLLIERKDTTEINSLQNIILGWQIKQHQLGLQFSYEQQNAIQNTISKYIGINYKYTFTHISSDLPEDPNEFTSQLSYNTKSNGKDFFWYNHLSYYLKTYQKQGIKSSINTYYQNTYKSNQFMQTKKHFFRNLQTNNKAYISAINFQNSYIFKRKNVHFYGIADFIYKKNIEKVSYSYINTGFGIRILSQKQHLTLAIFKAIKLSQNIDNQNITINISQIIKL